MLLIIIALLTVAHSYAQLSKGRMMINGSLSYSQNQNNQYDTSQNKHISGYKDYIFNGTLRCGYFVTGNILVGVYGSYGNQKYSNETQYGTPFFTSSSESTSSSYYTGIFSRYYKMIAKSKFAAFGQVSAGFGTGKTTNKNTTSNSGGSTATTNGSHESMSAISAGIAPGITYFLTNRLAFEMSFGNLAYNFQHTKNYDANNKLLTENKNSVFNSSLNLSFSSLTLGASFYFGGKPPVAEPAK
jgi:hypothetical protein